VAEPPRPPVVHAAQAQVHEVAALAEELRERALVRAVRQRVAVQVAFECKLWNRCLLRPLAGIQRSWSENGFSLDRFKGWNQALSSLREAEFNLYSPTRFFTYTVLSGSPWIGRRSMFAAIRAFFAKA
jgi:hypothetical protein